MVSLAFHYPLQYPYDIQCKRSSPPLDHQSPKTLASTNCLHAMQIYVHLLCMFKIILPYVNWKKSLVHLVVQWIHNSCDAYNPRASERLHGFIFIVIRKCHLGWLLLSYVRLRDFHFLHDTIEGLPSTHSSVARHTHWRICHSNLLSSVKSNIYFQYPKIQLEFY